MLHIVGFLLLWAGFFFLFWALAYAHYKQLRPAPLIGWVSFSVGLFLVVRLFLVVHLGHSVWGECHCPQ